MLEDELGGIVAVKDMSHEPMGFLSGTPLGAQVRWAAVNKEGYAIVSTFRELEDVPLGGVQIFIDHRNRA